MEKALLKGLYSEILRVIEKYVTVLNRERCGFGTDSHSTEKSQDHPMAYGLFTRGFARLYQAAGNKEYLETAVKCIERLQELSLSDRYLCWGLLMSWKGYSDSHPLAITTSMVGEGFLEVYRQTKEKTYLQDIDSIGTWLTEELEYEKVTEGAACPWYGPGRPLLTLNVASKVGAFLWQAGSLLGKAMFKEYGQRALSYVLLKQAPEGYWLYGEPNEDTPEADKTADNLHTAYTLDGLIDYYSDLSAYRRWRSRDVKAQIGRGVDFYASSLFVDGKPLEKLLIRDEEGIEDLHRRSVASRKWRTELLSGQRSLVFYPLESRLWGTGAALFTLAKAYRLEMVSLESWLSVFRFLEEKLATEDGHFRYKSDDDQFYIRHEAHVFNGLAEMLAVVKT